MTENKEKEKGHKEHEEMVAAGEPFTPEMESGTQEGAGNEEDEGSRLKRELAESQDKLLRLYSEFDNYRKRSTRERADYLKTAGEDIIKSLLPVLDDFERARNAFEKGADAQNGSFDGVTLIFHKLQSVLEQRGLKRMKSVGELFNEDLHEAISMIPAADDSQRDKVIDEAECGYYMHDKVIRHAKVIVAK